MTKTRIGLIALLITAVLLSSCVSTALYKPVSQAETESMTILGSVQCNFYSMTYLGAGRISRANKQQAYIELMKEANKTYEGKFDIRNITIAHVSINVEHGNEFTANGAVVLAKNSNASK
jgi:PBP1b-binding outer membrane lipoprotein LpoB